MVVNNWYIIMDGYVAVSGPWARVFFMVFYVVTVVRAVRLAFNMLQFLSRISASEHCSDHLHVVVCARACGVVVGESH